MFITIQTLNFAPCIWGTGVLEVYQCSIPRTQYSTHTAGILTQLNFEITTTKIWYLVSVPLRYAVWYTTSIVVSVLLHFRIPVIRHP
jgi:hypothetical protein